MIKRFLVFILIFILLAFTFVGSNAETLFFEGIFNANNNCAYYGSFPEGTSVVYLEVNSDGVYHSLSFNEDQTELILQSGTAVFKFSNGYWISSKTYPCWSELGVTPVTLSLYTSIPSGIDFGDGNQDYNDSVAPLLQWAFGSDFTLYSIDGLQTVLTDVNVFEFVTLLFTPKIFLSVVYYLGFSLMCCMVLGFIPMLFLFVWKFLLSTFLGRKRWFKR